MAGKLITLNKDEIIKVIELARGYLMTFEKNFICYSLFKGIECVKNIEIDFSDSNSYNILNHYFYGLLNITNDYISKHIDEYNYSHIFIEDNFQFNGDVWFYSHSTSMRELRIELLTLYLNELKKENDG